MDDNADSISEGYPGLMEEVKRVEEVTKKKFGEPFKLLIEEGSYVLDSLPPALAQMIVNETDPGRSVEFAGKLQAKLFEEGGDIKELSVLKELIHDFTISEEYYEDMMKSREKEKKTRERKSVVEGKR